MIQDMPNHTIRDEIQSTMKYGFEYGVPEYKLSLLTNKKVVYHSDRPDEIDKHLIKWLKEGQIYVDEEKEPLCYIPLFLKDEGNKTRLIPDFKHEVNGISINNLVLDKYKTVQYPTTEKLINFVYWNGQTEALAKNDGKSFFRQVMMSEPDQNYCAYYHRGITFFDSRMPWGTPRAPRIAHFLSLCLEYIAYKYIPLSLQPCIFSYVDDRIFRAKTMVQVLYIHIIYLIICARAGTPTKPSKTVLCSKSLVGLGVGFDLNGEKTVYVPQTKKVKYIKTFEDFICQSTATAKQAQSVVGKCEHVSWLKWPFRVYNRILYNAIPAYTEENQIIIITPQIRYAVTQWIHALECTKPAKLELLVNPPKIFDYTIETDGSDIGYGGIEGSQYFFDQYYKNEINPSERNIKDRELYPIALILETNGYKYQHSNILIKCDNKNAVSALINKDIRNPRSHNLVIKICETAIKHDFRFHVEWIKGKSNHLADALSRLEINKFKKIAAQMKRNIDPAPLLFRRLPFDFGSGTINTKFQNLTYRD